MRLEQLAQRAAPWYSFLLVVSLAFASSQGELRGPASWFRWVLLLSAAAVGFVLWLTGWVRVGWYTWLWLAFAVLACVSATWSIAPQHSLVHGATIFMLVFGIFVAFASAALAVAVMIEPGIATHFVGQNTISSLGGRTEAWARAVDAFERRPIAGYGFATEQQLLAPYKRYRLLRLAGRQNEIPAPYPETTLLHFTGGFVESSYVCPAAPLGILA